MSVFTFENIFTTDMRDSKGSVMTLVEITGIDGNYTPGGIILRPEEFDLKTIEFIGMNNFFAFPGDESGYNPEAGWVKVVDFIPTQHILPNGETVWKIVIFLYQDGVASELVEVPMEFLPEVPFRMMVLGSKRTRR